MKLAIISTTIRGEKGYLPYDRLALKSKFSSVEFFIAGDLQSPPFDRTRLECRCEYLDAQAQAVYASSEPIGWRKFARRNIALLKAIESQPDYILTIDDDNIPADDYFDRWYAVVTTPARQVVAPINGGRGVFWHNYLETSDADILLYPRGFPIPFRGERTTHVVEAGGPIPPDRIGVFQGISLGDPDIDAATRIVYSKPLPLNSIGQKNYCLKDVWSPYNTQNTLLAKPLFPLAFTWPQAGRFEDIYASFVWQQFLFNNDMYAHVGDAVNRQDRGKRNDLRDLKLEVEGYLHGHDVWKEVNEITEKDPVAFIERLLASDHPIVQREREFLRAYLMDIHDIHGSL